jgi:hypothetical protein
MHLFGLVVSLLSVPAASAFSSCSRQTHRRFPLATILHSSSGDAPSDVAAWAELTLADLKTNLVRVCSRESKPLADEVKSVVQELESKAEQVCISHVG